MMIRKYSHLLSRSKPIFISHKTWVHETGSITPHHRLLLPPPPPPPSPPQFSTLHSLQLPNHEPAMDGYKLTVKGRDVISAAQPPAHQFRLPQSNLDLLLPALDAGVFFCYKRKDNMQPESVVKTIKESLAGVLSTYYPLAGEIVPNSAGEPEVVCNNGGVEFIHAHADVELETLDLHHPDETVKGKLVPKINRGVMAVQVTELKCGSIILSCAIDHRIADAYSLNMFLVSWSEFAQFKQTSTTPSFRPSILKPRRPSRYNPIFDNMYLPTSSLPRPQPPHEHHLHSRIYYIRAESITHLQSKASSNQTTTTKFQSFTSFLWKLLGQECDNDMSTNTSRMGIIVNGRRFLTGNSDQDSIFFKTHFGNILSIPYGEERNCDLRAMPLQEVAKKIHGFVREATNEEHFRGLVDWVELHCREPAIARVYLKLKESDGEGVVVSSGLGLPVKEMKFGWGEPQFGSYHMGWGGETGYIVTMPSACNKNGDWIVYVHLKQKHLDLIDRKATHVFNPLHTIS